MPGFNKLVRFQRFEKCKIHKFSGGACPRTPLVTKETHSLEKHKLESSVLVLLVSKKRFGVGKMRVCLRIESSSSSSNLYFARVIPSIQTVLLSIGALEFKNLQYTFKERRKLE